MQKQINAHRMVADMCVELAERVYDELATKSDKWFKANVRQDFVKGCAPTLRYEARQILAGMLEQNIPAQQKDKIFEALMLDKTLPDTGWEMQKEINV